MYRRRSVPAWGQREKKFLPTDGDWLGGIVVWSYSRGGGICIPIRRIDLGSLTGVCHTGPKEIVFSDTTGSRPCCHTACHTVGSKIRAGKSRKPSCVPPAFFSRVGMDIIVRENTRDNNPHYNPPHRGDQWGPRGVHREWGRSRKAFEHPPAPIYQIKRKFRISRENSKNRNQRQSVRTS